MGPPPAHLPGPHRQRVAHPPLLDAARGLDLGVGPAAGGAAEGADDQLPEERHPRQQQPRHALRRGTVRRGAGSGTRRPHSTATAPRRALTLRWHFMHRDSISAGRCSPSSASSGRNRAAPVPAPASTAPSADILWSAAAPPHRAGAARRHVTEGARGEGGGSNGEVGGAARGWVNGSGRVATPTSCSHAHRV